MRQSVLLFVGLVLSGCAFAGEPGGSRPSPMVQSYPGAETTLQRVSGQEMMDEPLLPQPGNIWADVLPGRVEPPAATAMPTRVHSGDGLRSATAPGRQPAPLAEMAAGSVAKTVPVSRPAPLGKTETAVGDMAKTMPVRRRVRLVKTAAAADVTKRAGPVKSAKMAVEPSLSGVADSGERPMVQLAAAASAKQAVAAWRRLRRADPGLTGGHEPAISAAEVNGRRVWRLRAGGFDDVAAARSFCSGLHAANTDCWVVPASALR